MKKSIISFVLIALFFSMDTTAQNRFKNTVSQYLNEHYPDLGVTASDVSEFIITDEVPTKSTGVWHVHITQSIKGILVENARANVLIDSNGEVVSIVGTLIPNLSSRIVGSNIPALAPLGAVDKAKEFLALSGQMGVLLERSNNKYTFGKGSLSLENIRVEQVYWYAGEEIRLAWKLDIYQTNAEHWWQFVIDAENGSELERYDWVVRCEFPEHSSTWHNHATSTENFDASEALPPMAAPLAPASSVSASYNVYPLPVESPIHGSRALLTDPHDTVASPYGWHDTDGIDGAEYTITRGNNVYAYTDTTDNNTPDFSPDGGTALNFDFPLDLNQQPGAYKSAATTNLFYMNNRIHDIMWHYGLDEPNGNFQFNNYGNGGLGSDEVNAEAQDGGGINNANFATPTDGFSGRMQMYLWTGTVTNGDMFDIHAPASIAGLYPGTGATFGPPLTSTPLTGDVALLLDAAADSLNACDSIINPMDVAGKIAIVRRGLCSFVSKAQAAQDAGAIAVIVVNSNNTVFTLNGTSTSITIPVTCMRLNDGNAIINALNQGDSVNLSMSLPLGLGQDRDGDLDNGIIIHEYAHGISNRMTGGPSNSSCLSGQEQMGEGWSDFYGIMMTMDTAVNNPIRRPMGTYAVFESPTTGGGIRPAPYDTSFSVNNYTYGDIANAGISVPHGVGFVWCTMLWDLNWAFIDQYGFDEELIGGTGGNSMVFKLVTDALTLQPCNPGFVDGRDAILQADMLAYGGANQCLIWEVFARRGLGVSADQGSSSSRSDGIEAFDLPLLCQIPTEAPTADFVANRDTSCTGEFIFDDLSFNVPQSWLWDFGDGNTDSIRFPTHTYAGVGSYTVTLTVSNSLGQDTEVKTSYVHVVAPTDNPVVTGGSGCSADSIVLTAQGNGTPQWYDASGTLVGTGNTFLTAPSATSQTYTVRDAFVDPIDFAGPVNNNFGGGGYHGTTFVGTVNFDAEKALTVISAFVDADGPGPRVVNLWDGPSGNGVLLQSVTVNITQTGPQRVNLNLSVPGPGSYSIGLDFADLYRNNSGANYPYTAPGLITITGSPAGPDFYYYFYDLEVQDLGCFGAPVTVGATVLDIIDFSYATNGQTVQFTDASPNATSWSWDFGDGNTSSIQNPQHTYAADGVYDVTLMTDGGLCSKVETVVIGTIGLNDPIELSAEVYPNPAVEAVTITLNAPLLQDATIEVYTLEGRLVMSTEVSSGKNEITLDVRSLANGVYWINLESDGQGIREKMVIQK